jgi:ComF family protein
METELNRDNGRRRLKFVSHTLLNRVTRVFKIALFPTRCLVCGSFFQPAHPQESQYPIQSPLDVLPSLSRRADDPEPKSLISADLFAGSFQILFEPFLCPLCLSAFQPLESPFCVKCGVMFLGRQGEDHLCGQCLKDPKRFQMARAPGVYSRTLMEVIHCYKYRRKTQLAEPLGALLFVALVRYWKLNSIDLVLPVPLHIGRLRQRGFNQVFLLVRDWNRMAKQLTTGRSHIHIEFDLLTKNGSTESQTGLARKQRLTNVKNVFSVRDPFKIEDKRILLVDDVLTTGATVDECAGVLLNNGAQSVDVLTLARAL